MRGGAQEEVALKQGRGPRLANRSSSGRGRLKVGSFTESEVSQAVSRERAETRLEDKIFWPHHLSLSLSLSLSFSNFD